ncbi:hypothetical protein HDU99_006055, partial [Rhizoclosmatium hyalinum]
MEASKASAPLIHHAHLLLSLDNSAPLSTSSCLATSESPISSTAYLRGAGGINLLDDAIPSPKLSPQISERSGSPQLSSLTLFSVDDGSTLSHLTNDYQEIYETSEGPNEIQALLSVSSSNAVPLFQIETGNMEGSNDKLHMCAQPGCSVSFLRRHDLLRHQRSVHLLTQRILACSKCGKQFARTDS